jgi:multidrug efflux pump
MVRFRPVMLTAITTALSLLLTVFGFSLDVRNFRIERGGSSAEMWGSMANAVVTGLLVATFLTLVAVPVMYVSQTRLAIGSSESGPTRSVGLCSV